MKLPYNLTPDQLVLDPGASSNITEVRESLNALVNDPVGLDPEESLRLVGYSTMLLLLHTDGTFAECLDTAIVWLCG